MLKISLSTLFKQHPTDSDIEGFVHSVQLTNLLISLESSSKLDFEIEIYLKLNCLVSKYLENKSPENNNNNKLESKSIFLLL